MLDPDAHLRIAVPWLCGTLHAVTGHLAESGKPATALEAMLVCHIAGCSRVTGSASGVPQAGEAGCDERCAALVHLVDGTQDDVAGAYRTIRGELEEYGHGVTDKPELLCLSKCDALDEATVAAKRAELEAAAGRPAFVISAVAQQGLEPVLRAAWELVRARRQERVGEASEPAPRAAARRHRPRRPNGCAF